MAVLAVSFYSVADCASQSNSRVISGVVFDSSSMKPIPAATVQVVGTGRSSLTNDDGRYRLLVDSGVCQLKFSHVAYFSSTLNVPAKDTLITLDSYLHPTLIEIKGMTVYTKSYDAAQQIIVEAIARKKQMLKELQAYCLKAYLRAVVKDRSKPDSLSIFAILESQNRYNWEYPEKVKSVVEMRRQTANIPREAFMPLEDVIMLYSNRIEFEDLQIVSPIADDALDHYAYTLEDSILIDGQMAFVIGIRPKNENEPLFEGTFQIADSSYALISSDLKSTKGFHISYIENWRMREHYVQFRQKFAMPVESRSEFDVHIDFPGIPGDLSFESVASLHDYSFERDTTGKVFDDYAVEVAPDVDKFDSTTWNERQSIPLSWAERRSYARIDSIEKAPKPFGKKVLQGALGLVALSLLKADIFHFNRVEGAYVGFAGSLDRAIPRTGLRAKSGYSIDGHFWEHEYGVTYELAERRRLRVNLLYHDQVMARPTIITSQNANMTLFALLYKGDVLDYFRERGFGAGLSLRPLRHVNAGIGYRSYKQWSAPVSSSYSVFQKDKAAPVNPLIKDGRLCALEYRIGYDSRLLGRNKGREFIMESGQSLIAELRIEDARSSLLGSDFSFQRYQVSMRLKRQMLGLGPLSMLAFGGVSNGVLPPQEHFIVDRGYGPLGRSLGFANMGENNFEGDRVLAVYVRHDFRATLFAKSGLPLIKKIPLFLSIFGGAFWSDFHNPESRQKEGVVYTAQKPYREMGFGLGNLTPFLTLWNLQLDFTWQLSHYGKNNFGVSININP